MTSEEKTFNSHKAIELIKYGIPEECEQMMKQIILQPYLAKNGKGYFTTDSL
jgi:predicted nucleic acid-binding Zn ribbon protein